MSSSTNNLLTGSTAKWFILDYIFIDLVEKTLAAKPNATEAGYYCTICFLLPSPLQQRFNAPFSAACLRS